MPTILDHESMHTQTDMVWCGASTLVAASATSEARKEHCMGGTEYACGRKKPLPHSEDVPVLLILATKHVPPLAGLEVSEFSLIGLGQARMSRGRGMLFCTENMSENSAGFKDKTSHITTNLQRQKLLISASESSQ